MFGMFGISPEEYEAKMEEQRLNSETYKHDLHEWFDTMDAHQLKLLRSLLFDYSEHNSAAYLIGFLSFLLEKKFKVCAACGKDHDAPLTVEEVVGKSGDTGNSEGPHVHVEGGSFHGMSGPELLASVPESEQETMDQYGLDFVEHQYPKVVCANCGTEYVSLKDRMRREPGVKGCSGCQNKAKWG